MRMRSDYKNLDELNKNLDRVFGNLTIIEFLKPNKDILVKTKCQCGVVSNKYWSNVRTGKTKSCGCGEISARKTHGLSKDPTYNSWENMINRCSTGSKQNKTNKKYQGLFVCESWSKFENFVLDMGLRPNKTTLDRINNDLGYFKENCRWADKKTQQQNMSSNHNITFNGETKCLSEWSRCLKIPVTTLLYRLKTKSVPETFGFKA
jgi:hypothetical protein